MSKKTWWRRTTMNSFIDTYIVIVTEFIIEKKLHVEDEKRLVSSAKRRAVECFMDLCRSLM